MPLSNNPNRKPDQRGYSLVEVSIAGTILAVLIVAVNSMIRSSVELESGTDFRRQATDLLYSTMDMKEFHPRDTSEWRLMRLGSWPRNLPCTIRSQSGTLTCTLVAGLDSGSRSVDGTMVDFRSVAVTLTVSGETLTDTLFLSPLVFNQAAN